MNEGGELETLDYNTEPMRDRNPTLRLQQPWSLSPERWSELQRNTGRHHVSSFSRIHRNNLNDLTKQLEVSPYRSFARAIQSIGLSVPRFWLPRPGQQPLLRAYRGLHDRGYTIGYKSD